MTTETKAELSVVADPKDLKGSKLLAGLQKQNPDVLFLITRSKNLNVVVYQALRDKEKKLASSPVDVFWLDIDPEYVKANRKKGVKTDRSDLNSIEKAMAYGISAEKVKDKDEFTLTLVSLKGRSVTLSLDKNGVARAVITINKKQCYITRIYVSSVDRIIPPIPRVDFIELYGIPVDGGDEVVETIKP